MLLVLSYITVEGYITDSLNQRIPFAVIKVKELNKGTYSDEKGYYYLKLPDGKWTLEVRAIGKEIKKITVSGKDTALTLNIYLMDKPITTKEIIITAKREEFKKGTGQALKFDVKVIRQRPNFLTSDILRTLQDIPGVVGLADFSGKFSVRSGGPYENAVFLDNALIFNPYHLGGFFSIFDSDALESFTFYRSNYPPIYGGVMSSVLDIKTLNPDSTYGNISISLLASKFFQAFRRDKYGGFISARRSYFDITLRWFDYDFPYYFYDILGKLYYDINPNIIISITFMNGRDRFNFNINQAFLRSVWGNDVMAFNSRWILGDWVNFTTISSTYFTNSISIGYEDQKFLELNSPMSLTEFKSRFENVSDERDIIFGFEVHRGFGSFDQNFFGSYMRLSGIAYTSALYGEYLHKGGFYNLSLGLRLNGFLRKIFNDPNRNIVFLNPEPRITFKYFLSPDIAIKGGFGVFHQYYIGLTGAGGTLGEVLSSFYYWVPVYRGFDPPKSFHYSLGIAGITPWGDWELEAFYKDYPRMVVENHNIDPKDIFGTLFRTGYGWAYGFDGYIRKDIGNFQGMISYSFLVGRMRIADTLMNSPYDRRNAIIASLSYSFKGDLHLGFRFTYQTGLPYTGVIARYDIYTIYDPGTGKPARLRTEEIYSYPYSLRYPDYHRADVFISKDFRIRKLSARVSLSVINIYNRKNVFTYFYDYSKDPPQKIVIPQLPLFPSLELFIVW